MIPVLHRKTHSSPKRKINGADPNNRLTLRNYGRMVLNSAV
jgi:hypothetical protein